MNCWRIIEDDRRCPQAAKWWSERVCVVACDEHREMAERDAGLPLGFVELTPSLERDIATFVPERAAIFVPANGDAAFFPQNSQSKRDRRN